jgi:hypothetical protein
LEKTQIKHLGGLDSVTHEFVERFGARKSVSQRADYLRHLIVRLPLGRREENKTATLLSESTALKLGRCVSTLPQSQNIKVIPSAAKFTTCSRSPAACPPNIELFALHPSVRSYLVSMCLMLNLLKYAEISQKRRCQKALQK